MKRITGLAITLAFGALSLAAQGKGKAAGQPSRPAQESNAPARTPNRTVDRDFGRDRAAEVGQGKKTGLDKQGKVKPSRTKTKKSR
jgi:hypothetical protein